MCHSTVHFQQWITSELRVDGSARNDAVFILNFDALPPGEKWECALSQFSMQGSGEAVTDADGNQAPIGVVILDGLNAPYNRQVSEHTNMPSGILSRMDFSTAGAGPNTCSVNPSSLAPAICCTLGCRAGLLRQDVPGTWLRCPRRCPGAVNRKPRATRDV